MHIDIKRIVNKSYHSFFLIAGPCVVEDYDTCAITVEEIKRIIDPLKIPYIFKASFKKANRTSIDSFSTIGEEKAIDILKSIKATFKLAITTDIHEVKDIALVSEIVDLIQIPAFLCRQTDLIVAAGASGLPVNIKKGQFMNALSMKYAADKVRSAGNPYVMITERGNTFGYDDLVVDFRNIPLLSALSSSVIMDCTHSTQRPNQQNGITGGNPEDIATLLKAAIVSGVDGLFIETHPNPSQALSDGANMLALNLFEDLIIKAHRLSLSTKEIYA